MERDGAEFELHGPMGVWGALRGIDAQPVLLAIIIAMQSALMFMLYSDTRDRQERYASLRIEMAEMVRRDSIAATDRMQILTAVANLSREQESTTWAILQDETVRSQLRKRMTMPKALRERLQ